MFIRLWLYKNHYNLISVDLSRQKELEADLKGFQQIEFVGKIFSKTCSKRIIKSDKLSRNES